MRKLSVWKDRVSRTQSFTQAHTNTIQRATSEMEILPQELLFIFLFVAVDVAVDSKIEYLEQEMNDIRQGQRKIII